MIPFNHAGFSPCRFRGVSNHLNMTISIAGTFNGYDTGSIGAMTTMLQFEAVKGRLSHSCLSFTVSLVMLAGAVPSFFAGYLAERFGRLRKILCGSVLVIIGAVLQGSANSLPQFLVGRAFSGCGQGLFVRNVNVLFVKLPRQNTVECLSDCRSFSRQPAFVWNISHIAVASNFMEAYLPLI
ncbi:hypothetical protein GGI43DRAFT_418932 [Trichoderma evansii]